jgi:hypothetical protein
MSDGGWCKSRDIDPDPEAESADPALPAFLARPESARVYHGFGLSDDVEVDGFKLGAITDFGPDVDDGDAFLVAPDNSRAGLIWELSSETFVDQVIAPEPGRWGVWRVSFPCAVTDSASVAVVLADLVPRLRGHWDAWRAEHGSETKT